MNIKLSLLRTFLFNLYNGGNLEIKVIASGEKFKFYYLK